MSNSSSATLLFYDFETWGANPQKDPACQFAAIRTDMAFNPVDKPINLFCQIPNDYLPHPEACLITGITPQQSLRDGDIEAAFYQRIYQEFTRPNTCVLGYNSIRFDDEVTRFGFYRNFYDPYQREWQHGNSRWDIIDMVRACYALRPDGIQWPQKKDGTVSFKLEDLAKANELAHEQAHDALSDVHATINLARLVKQKQPKLFDYLFSLRNKRKVAELIDYHHFTPLVHVSSKLPSVNGCCTWIVPVAPHPSNKNAIICLNLALDPRPLLALTKEQLLARLYTRTSELNEGEERLPIKLIHLNKAPVLAPAKTLSENDAQRLHIDREKCLENLQFIRQHPEIGAKLQEMYGVEGERTALDPDFALYAGGFFSDSDKRQMEIIRTTAPEALGSREWQFDDPRLPTLLFRYRARNYPHTLNDDELQKWQAHRRYRLNDPSSGASITLNDFIQKLENLVEMQQNDPDKVAIMRALYNYAASL